MVFDWLKKKLGGAKPERRKSDLDDASVERLGKSFEPLDSLRPGIEERTLNHVLFGDDSEVLLQLPALKGASTAIDLRSREDWIPGHQRREFFAGLERRDPAIFLRLARVWEAISRSEPRKLHITWPVEDLEWLEIFLMEASGFQRNVHPSPYFRCSTVDALMIEAMLEADGKAPDVLVRTVLFSQTAGYWSMAAIKLLAQTPGLAGRLAARANVVLEALARPGAEERLQTFKWLEELEVDPAPITDRLIELAVSSSKQVRERAESLLRKVGSAAIPGIERQAREAGNDERIFAVRLLWRLRGEEARPFLERRLDDEKNKRVLEALRELVGTAPAPASTPALVLSPLPVVDVHAPLSPTAREALRDCLHKIESATLKEHARTKTSLQEKTLGPWALDDVISTLENLDLRKGQFFSKFPLSRWFDEVWKPIYAFCEHPDVALIHVVRLVVVLKTLRYQGEGEPMLYSPAVVMIERRQRSLPRRATLRELGAVFEAVGLDPLTPGQERLRSWHRVQLLGAPADTAWEYFSERLKLIQLALEPSNDLWQSERKRNALDILATFPQPPAELLPRLWEMALGPKTHRDKAQACLEKLPDTRARVLASLGNGKSEIRATAAEWLARLRDKGAVEPLLAAVRKEKHEAAKGAFMSALEDLGVPVEQFLDRKGLADEARKGLAKGVPASLEGFPFAVLPVVHWADDGSAVDPEILRWFIVQACKLKDPEPGVLLRRYAALFKPGEREAFGDYVLSAWIDLDVAPISRAEAEKQAQSHAQMIYNWSKNPNSNMPQQTLEQFYAAALPQFLNRPKGSAIDAKGVLAVASACGGPGIAPQVSRYLKQWYGLRGAQSKALVQMLAWVEHPTAIQLVLAVGNRFRTKGIQEEAARQAQLIADRKGWTLEELADRTIPSAGLDENGEMTLDFGPRRFTVRLGDDLELVLTSAEGKVLSSLPDPRAGDDEELAKEAKKQFSASKKELKSALKMQSERLYEAMCIQRTWSYEDWDRYLNRHPLVRHLCGRLVWFVRRGDAVVTFRPLNDGTLTDVAEGIVTVAADEDVGLAHDCNTPADAAKAWGTHFADYEVEPLFQQFGRPAFTLTEERKQSMSLEDFLGHLLDAFALRGRATKLGYTRGQAQDGGWFYDYHKRFPTLGLEAVIEFSGNGLPEENRKVALKSLHFLPTGQDDGSRSALPLGEIPSVLLAETWNDLRSIAAESSGFDPDWEKKTQP